MVAITATMVGELRRKTDAPIMECKKALTDADGNIAKAEELLRVKLGAKASKVTSRVAADGVVSCFVENDIGALVEFNCETDFVAKNASFLALAQAAARLVAQHSPADLLAASSLPYVQDGFGPTLEDVRVGLVGKIGENLNFRRFQRYANCGKLAYYLHGTRIGVLLDYDGDGAVARDVAMHIAAMKPIALSALDVDIDLIERERSIATAKAEEDKRLSLLAGKTTQSDAIVAKRIEGSVQKFLKEVSLLNQAFVKNDKQTVEQMLQATNTKINKFTLYVMGEGIEKKENDFVAEVAAAQAEAQQKV